MLRLKKLLNYYKKSVKKYLNFFYNVNITFTLTPNNFNNNFKKVLYII